MRNIFYIHRFPFNKEAYIRDEFEYLIEQGFNVKYIEISHLLKKTKFDNPCPDELKEHVIDIASKKAFYQFLLEDKKNSIIITDVGLLANSAWMYIGIFKANIPYVLFENSVLPKIKTEHKGIETTKFFRRLNFKKIILKPIEMFQFSYANRIKQPAKLIITGKKKLSTEKKQLKGKSSKIKYTMSLDYKASEKTCDKPLLQEPYAVFVDQYFCHHIDFKTNHIVHNFTAEQYYPELNAFLKQFKEASGLKVVIASHPRRNKAQQSDFDPDFEIYYNKTADLIKFADICLIHFSTAINYAVIFNKPFVLLNSDLFKKSSVDPYIEMFANFFHKASINISKPYTYDNEWTYQINHETYRTYFEEYIKHPLSDNESFREIIIKAITEEI